MAIFPALLEQKRRYEQLLVPSLLYGELFLNQQQNFISGPDDSEICWCQEASSYRKS